MTPAERIKAQAKEATRRALLEAGLAELIDKGGLELPSLEAICSRAGYTRGVFYAYFEDRSQFVAEMLEWVVTDIAQALFESAARGAEDIAEVINRFNETLIAGEFPDLSRGVRAGYLGVLRELRNTEQIRAKHSEVMGAIISQLEDKVVEGQVAGTLRPGVNAHDVALVLVLAAVGTIMWDDVGIAMDLKAIGACLIALLQSSS